MAHSCRAALCAWLLGFCCAGFALADSNGSALPDGGFEQGLGNWVPSGASSPFFQVLSPAGGQGAWAAGCDLNPGQAAGLERRLPIAAGQFVSESPAPGVSGRKLEFGLWVWLSAASGQGEVWLELASFDGQNETPLACSAHWDVDLLPRSQWLLLSSEPLAVVDGRVPAGAVELRYSLHTSASGLVIFDAARVRHFERDELPLMDASFEAWVPSQSAWTLSGTVLVGPSTPGQTGYYGLGHALLQGASNPSLSQSVDVGSVVDQFPLACGGQRVEAGCWLRFADGSSLPPYPDPGTFVELSVLARGNGPERRVAHGRWLATASEAGHWVHLQADSSAALDLAESTLRVEVGGSFGGELALDFVQLAEQYGQDGNPRRRVGCNYVGRYRSPLYDGSGPVQTPEERWRNWHWQTPPACSGVFEGFYHSPDCATSATCRRASGRRDLASSAELSPDDLPLVGSYDSRDPAVIRYHLKLAASAGIDHFIFDWLGHAIALQEQALGRDAINEETWQALVSECERPGVDIKLAVMYEPKAHFAGWVQGQPTKADKIAGMTSDLVYLARSMAGQRSALRHDNRLVLFIFRNQLCNPSGTQCLFESDWWQIHDAVLQATGESLFLVGDSEPAGGSALQGFTRWKLVQREILVYRNWSDVRDGVATLPIPQLSSLVSHTRALAAEVLDWQARADQERVAVLTVWPGFDDGGVGGWGQDNLWGEDGAALCVRVADSFAGQFYSTTVDAAFEGPADWIQIATWNDWNEATRIEPAWHPDFHAPTLVGQQRSALVEEQVFGRLEETRQWIQAFKGQAAGGAPFRLIADEYLRRALRNPGVALYD